VLQRLGDDIADALERAAEADGRAAAATDPDMRLEYGRLALSWRRLAQSMEFVERLEKFLLEAESQANLPETGAPNRQGRLASDSIDKLFKDTRPCPTCARAMKLIDSVPAMDGLPEAHTFRCFGCNEVIAEAVDDKWMRGE
jgi:hypothetical protein